MGLEPLVGGGVEDVSIRIDEVEEVIEVEEGDDIDIDVEVGTVDTRERRSIEVVEPGDLDHNGDVTDGDDIESWEDHNIRWDRKLENVHCELRGNVGGHSDSTIRATVVLDEGGEFRERFDLNGGGHVREPDRDSVDESIGDGRLDVVTFSGINYRREDWAGHHGTSELTITADVIVEREAVTDIDISK